MRIHAQVQTLDEALDAWLCYRQIPYEKFTGEKDTQYMVCHAMLLAIQASIDITTAMAVLKTPRRPDTYCEMRGTSSLPQRGRQPKGVHPLDPHFGLLFCENSPFTF